MNSSRLYLDNAATQRLRPEAHAAMQEAAHQLNPAGQYSSGRTARRVLEDSREQVAELLGADAAEVIFTGSGTEADNVAIQGLAFGSLAHRQARLVASAAIEHPAVAESVDWLTHGPIDFGFERADLQVDAGGRVKTDPDVLETILKSGENVAVMTCMWANNETGNIQPVGELARFARERNIPFHTDAVQAVGHVPVNFHELGATTLAAIAHKFGGPKSVGILLARRDADILSPVRGGGQERKLRSGTVNVQGAAGAAAALAASVQRMEEENLEAANRRDRLRAAVEKVDGVRIWTQEPALAGHLHFSVPGAEGDSMIMLLDAAGVDASTGSACSAGVNRASTVLTAMGVDVSVARGALRLTVGPDADLNAVDDLAERLPRILEQARSAGMAF